MNSLTELPFRAIGGTIMEIKDTDASNQEEYRYDITKEDIQKHPLRSYQGNIIVIDKEENIKSAVKAIRKYKCIGFDTESRPSFHKGEKHPVSLVQIATDKAVYLFRINLTGLTHELSSLIQDESITKIGLGLLNDMRELLGERREYRGFLDLETIAEKNGFKKRGVRALAAHFLGIRISKSSQVSNWERKELTEKQIRYAATDAWVCLRIYDAMRKAPDIEL